jgi:hypothetical protein
MRTPDSLLLEAQKIAQGYVAGIHRTTDPYTAALAQQRCQQFLAELRQALLPAAPVGQSAEVPPKE